MPNTQTVIAAPFKFPMGKPVLKALQPGDPLILKKEPTNQFDANAIQVIGKDVEGHEVQLGYIPAKVAAHLSKCHLTACYKHPSSWDAIVIEYTE